MVSLPASPCKKLYGYLMKLCDHCMSPSGDEVLERALYKSGFTACFLKKKHIAETDLTITQLALSHADSFVCCRIEEDP